jgi:hypothetical protein
VADGTLVGLSFEEHRRLRIARSYLIAGTQLIAALAIVPVALTHDLTVAIAGITVAVAARWAPTPPTMRSTSISSGGRRRRSASWISPRHRGLPRTAITGWVLDLRGSFADGFLLMAALALSSVLVVLLFHHPDEDRENMGL